MGRWLVAVGAIALATVALLPGAVGWWVAGELSGGMAADPDRAELLELESGWFETRGRLLARATGPGGVPLELPVTFSYRHGPVVWDGAPRLAWLRGEAEIAAADLSEQWQFERDRPLWRGGFQLGYGLSMTLEDSAQAFAYADQLVADHWRGAGTLGARGQFHYRGSLAGLRLIDAGSPLVLTGLDLELKRAASATEFETRIDLKGMQAGGAGDALRAEASRFEVGWRPDSTATGSGALALKVDADSLAVTGERYRNVALELSLAPVPAAFAARLAAVAEAIYLGRPPLAELTDLLAGVRQELLSAGPDLRLGRLAFEAPAGAFEMSGAARLPAAAVAPAHWLAVLPQLSLEVTAVAAKPLTLQWATSRSALGEQEELFNAGRAIDPAAVDARARARAQQQLASWVAAGWLLEEAEHYRVGAAWRNGQLELNGEPMGLWF